MALTVEALLEPVSPDNPVGEDLSYDNERAEIEQAFQREEMAEPDEAGEPDRDWRAVVRLIEAQFKRSKDLWLAVYLARAGAESGALETVEVGVEALAGLLETYWADVHPQLEELGVPGRKAPCDSLANRRTFLGPLEKTTLIAHPRLGRFSGADLERFRLNGSSEEGYGLFRGALDDLGPDSLQAALARLTSIDEALHRADKAFMAGAPGEDSTNFQPVYAVLAQLKSAVSSFVPGEGAEEPEDEGRGADDASDGAGRSRGERSVSGAINGREDVLRVFDLVSAYYRQREPSHPMPFMMERAKQWVAMDYMTLMRDIAPNGVSQAEGLLIPPTQF